MKPPIRIRGPFCVTMPVFEFELRQFLVLVPSCTYDLSLKVHFGDNMNIFWTNFGTVMRAWLCRIH